MKILRKALALTLVLALLAGSSAVYAVGDTMKSTNTLVIDNLPVTDFISGVSPYDGVVSVLSESEAQAAGVPSGYTGMVTKVGVGSNSSYAGVTIDPTSLNLPISYIESITLRVYLAGGTSLRLSNKGSANWAVLSTIESNTWVDYTVKADGTGLNNTTLSYFDDGNGNLGIFGIGSKNVKNIFIDSITVSLSDDYVVEGDNIPPVISYDGPTSLTAKEGDVFRLDGATAFDEQDNAVIPLSYEWSTGAIDGAGGLNVGTHTCVVKAQDRFGNASSIEITVTVAQDRSVIRAESIPHIPHSTSIVPSDYDGNVTELTSEQAAAAGLPAGYNGSVYEISYNSGKSYIGVCIDFSEYAIPISLVDSISFNVLMPTNYSELRMRNSNTTDWILRTSAAVTGSWTTVVMKADGTNFFGATGMGTLANDDGNLGSFCLIGRNSGTYDHYYIDSIVVKLKNDDELAPVINYTGKTDILTSSGKVFSPQISAYDELEGREIALEYSWSEGAVDADGNMLEGNHTCRVSATDYYGNTSYIDLNITVGPPDVEAPQIKFTTSEIYVPTGTFYRMAFVAIDNYDDVEVVEEWSEGAIDFGGRLSEGVHTLTLTATDLSGNKSVHVVTVYVLSTDTTVGTLIQCGK